MSKVWFVTGSGKGMGNAIVKEVLKHGDCVVATSHRGAVIDVDAEYADKILCLKLDISDPDQKLYKK